MGKGLQRELSESMAMFMKFQMKNNKVRCGCDRSSAPGEAVTPCFPLAMAAEGERVQISRVRSRGKMYERLMSMGLDFETEIIVIQKQPGGALLIESRGNRYAVGGGMAFKIQVRRC